MIENQHNDNLERFFKANLEGYSPVPSNDFWSKMEGAIPPKPAFWSGWRLAAAKWTGLAVLAAALVGVILLWQRDRHKMKKLNKTVAVQQAQIKAFEEKHTASIPAKGDIANEPSQLTAATTEPTPPSSENNSIRTEISSRPSRSKLGFQPDSTPEKGKGKQLPILKKTVNPPHEAQAGHEAANQSANDENLTEHQSNSILTQAANLPDQPSEFSPEPQSQDRLQLPSMLAALDLDVVSSKKHAPSTKHKLRRPNNPYPGFSIEVGATAFRMPLGRLFQQDTFLSGKTGISYGTGIRVNYELNSTTSFQVGYQFNNIRARKLALRYNHFPVMFQKRWAWSRRGYLEGKIGASVNSLVNAATSSDNGTVKGLNTTWLGLHTAISAAWPLSDKLKMVVGPSAGFAATPITKGRRSWDLGLAAAIRYQL